ncbi:MAG: CPBP family intramembrane metalloprotease [Thermoflexales bacterium]|nr:CPBP family intramembrane metalloprotease [Thermoflexales bacterium]
MTITTRTLSTTSKLGWLALPVSLIGMACLLYFGALQPNVIPSLWTGALTGNAFVDGKLKYQIVTFALALIVLALTAALRPDNAKRFYRLGNVAAPAQPMKVLGIKATDTWRSVGVTFAIFVSLATGAFIYFNLAQGQSLAAENLPYLPFILILSAMNAFTEEAITRFSVVTALDGLVSRPMIYVASALIFGVPHYFGTPGGVLGSIMAGFLGWLLARSVAETEGGFWAWFIHFLQDVIIIGGMFLVAL